MNRVEEILDIYKDLSEEEKIKLFISLDSMDMNEFHNPKYKLYDVKVKNGFGKLLVDRSFRSYSRWHVNRDVIDFLQRQKIWKHEEFRESYMDPNEIIEAKNKYYTEVIIEEIKQPCQNQNLPKAE